MASRFHILVVEDEPFVLDALQTTLETEYRVSSARYRGRGACDFENVARRYRAHRQRASRRPRLLRLPFSPERTGTPVIEMTGYAPEHVGLDASDRQHLFKPFGANVLLSTVWHALHGNQRSPLRVTVPVRATGGSPKMVLPPKRRKASCQTSAATCWMNGAARYFRRKSSLSTWRAQSATPSTFSSTSNQSSSSRQISVLKSGVAPNGYFRRR